MENLFNHRASSSSQISFIRVDKEGDMDPDCTQHLLGNAQGETTVVPIDKTLANRNATVTNIIATLTKKTATVTKKIATVTKKIATVTRLNAANRRMCGGAAFVAALLAILFNFTGIVVDALAGEKHIDSSISIAFSSEVGTNGDFAKESDHKAVRCRSDFSYICSAVSTILMFAALILLGCSRRGARPAR